MASRWRGEGDQHQGARSYQEDSWALAELNDGALLAVVADGMGGHAGGAVASRLVVETFVATVRGGGNLADGLQRANEAVGREAAARRSLAGMGATLVAARVRGDQVNWISVGDSPFFLVAGSGRLERLNADHSMTPKLQEMVRKGLMSEQEAARHPARHTLREAVMGEPLTLIDEGVRTLPPASRLLLCSDGVQTLDERDLARAAIRPVKDLVAAVLAAADPHQDNVTVIKLESAP